MRTIAIPAAVAAACALLIWVPPFLGAVRARSDEQYGGRRGMWGFWD